MKRWLHTPEKTCCFLPRDAVEIYLDNRVRISTSGSSNDGVSGSVEWDTLRKPLSEDGVFKLAEGRRAQEKPVIGLKTAK